MKTDRQAHHMTKQLLPHILYDLITNPADTIGCRKMKNAAQNK